MRGRMAGELGARRFEGGQIAGIADQPAIRGGQLGDFEIAPRPADHDMALFLLRRAGLARTRGEQAALGTGQLALFGDCDGRIGIDRCGIGAVSIDQAKLGITAPDRQRQRIEQRAQGGALDRQRFGERCRFDLLLLGFGEPARQRVALGEQCRDARAQPPGAKPPAAR